MRSAFVLLLLLFPLTPARAAEPEPPPIVTTPPPWLPYYAVPGPSPEQIQALEQSGRHKKRTGAILMGAGGTVALVGTSLLIAGAWEDHGGCGWRGDGRYRDGRYHDRACSDTALSIAGVTTSLLGLGALVPGVILYASGAGDVDRARRLKRTYFGPLSLHPTIGRDAVGLQLQLSR
jgi:hypothetical protein